MHAVRAEGVHRHHGAERRIDPPGKSEHHTGKAVLVDIVAQAGDAGEVVGGIALLHLGDLTGQAVPAPVLAAPFRQRECHLPSRELHGKLLIRIEHEGGAVEGKLVLAADLVEIGERPARLRHPRLRHAVTGLLLVHPIGRTVGHDQDLRTRLNEGLADVLGPDVLADRHTEAYAPEMDRRRHGACREDALLIEHAVIRQVVLVAHRLDTARVQERHRVVDERRLAPGQPHQDGRPAVGRILRQRLAGLARRALQGRLQHQIFERIAGEIELGEDDQVGAGLAHGRARRPGSLEIALDIAHDRVELRKRELE